MKIKYMLLALMPLCIASCSDEETVSSAGNGQEVRVTAGVGSHSRMVLNDQGTYTESLWQNGDCISLFTATQSNLTYSTAIEDSATTAEFTATDESLQYIEGNSVYACYPEVTATEENNLIVNLPTTDSFDYNNGTVRSFCYAVDKIASGSLNFKFKHISAFLCLTVTPEMLTDATQGINTVKVTTSSNKPLSVGEGDTFDLFTQKTSITNGSNTVQINVDNQLVEVSWTIYIPLLPQPAGADITITLADSEGTILYTVTKPTPESGFLAGYVYKQETSDVAYLIDGPTFNERIKELANGNNYSWNDKKIGHIEFVTGVGTLPETYVNVSADDSPTLIYASFSETDSLLMVSTPAKNIEVVNAANMFWYLTELRTINLGNFNINKRTTNTASMFSGCSQLTSLDVSNWDTSNITDMSGIFMECSKLTSLDVSNWDTSNVTSMNAVFASCSGLISLDVSNWDTSKVTVLSYIFSGCSGLTELDVSGWDTSKVTNMGNVFNYCQDLTSLDVSGWDTSNVTNMERSFYNCSSLTFLDVSGWDTSNVTRMYHVFYDCSSLTELDVSRWDTSNVTGMSAVFFGCSSLTSLNISNWNTSNITDMSGIFAYCSELTSLDVSRWDTSNVTNMNDVFAGCSRLTGLDVSGWDTSNVTHMSGVFSGCSGLTSLDVSGWNTSKVTNMSAIFSGCSELTSLDVSNWDTSNVTVLSSVFSGCSGLTELDVSGWDISKVGTMKSFFYCCNNLSQLNISNWSFNDNIYLTDMFYDCAATSQACRVKSTLDAKEFLLARTETTWMNPDWFIWEEDGSSFDDMPKEEW